MYAETTAIQGRHSAIDAIMAALEAQAMDADADDVHEASLLQRHQRLGHLAFNTIERMRAIRLRAFNSSARNAWRVCPFREGKVTRNAQSQKDSGDNSPIARIGVIFSELKGPMTPRDRLGNRYLFNLPLTVSRTNAVCTWRTRRTRRRSSLKRSSFTLRSSWVSRFPCCERTALGSTPTLTSSASACVLHAKCRKREIRYQTARQRVAPNGA